MASSFEPALNNISSSARSQLPAGVEPALRDSQDAATVSRAGTLPDPEEMKADRVTISDEALRKLGLLKDQQPSQPGESTSQKNSASDASRSQRLDYLKQRDREVRAHEQAHVIAGGALVRGGANFGYATGPDGKLYAVSGEVSIDSSAIPEDPAATIRKMNQVIKAALAPAQPSGQDRSVASSAAKTQMSAQTALTQQQLADLQSKSDSGTSESAKNDSTGTAKIGAPKEPKTSQPAGQKPAAETTPGTQVRSTDLPGQQPAPRATQATVQTATSPTTLASPATPLVSKYINIQA
jgi:hypothetical protein